jgi:hypothetical protein
LREQGVDQQHGLDVCWHLLTYADVWLDVCWRMLTYADAYITD